MTASSEAITEFIGRREVGRLYRVDPKTVDRWARDGHLPEDAVVTTPSGRKKYRRAVLEADAAQRGFSEFSSLSDD